MGKRVGKDAVVHKQTYPAVFGLDESRQQAEREVAAALDALADFDRRADHLRALAGYVTRRDS
jgi:geranylgeranyl pyrophosphate synthase